MTYKLWFILLNKVFNPAWNLSLQGFGNLLGNLAAIKSQHTEFALSSDVINVHSLTLFCECLYYWLWYTKLMLFPDINQSKIFFTCVGYWLRFTLQIFPKERAIRLTIVEMLDIIVFYCQSILRYAVIIIIS